MPRASFKDFKFQTKVLLAVVGVMVLLVAATMFMVNHRLNQQLHDDTKQALMTAEAVFKNSQTIRAKNLFLRFRNIAQEPRYRAACQQQDPKTLQALLEDLLKSDLGSDIVGSDIVQFANNEGKVIAAARRTDIDLAEFAQKSQPSLKQTMEGVLEQASTVIGVSRRLFDTISVPVVTPVDKDIIGTLTFGVQIDDLQAREFSEITGSDIVLVAKDRVTASSLKRPELFQQCVDLFGVMQPGTTRAPTTLSNEHFLALAGRLNSLSGDQQLGYVLIYSYQEPLRELQATQRMIIGVGFAGMLLSSLLVWLLIRNITKPLRELRDTAEAVGRGDFSCKVNVASRDECGELGLVFNRMTDRLETSRQNLEKAHKEVIETSRLAGMAEVATGVLHNVGNVLNSVNVSSSCVMSNVRKSKVSNLSRVVALLRQHEADLGGFMTNDPKGKQLPAYLSTLAEHLCDENDETLKELAHLQKDIEHIKDIIGMQQSFAKVSGVAETVNPADLVEDALRMNATMLARHDIQLIKEFKDVPLVTVEKHKVLQILVNLIRNAKHACADSGRIDKQLTIRVTNGDGRVRISVSDNGVGIPKENLTRIFSHGFTTKKDGHGFGLHSGVLAAKELGGSLNVESEGPGKGATFTVELPLPSTKCAAEGT